MEKLSFLSFALFSLFSLRLDLVKWMEREEEIANVVECGSLSTKIKMLKTWSCGSRVKMMKKDKTIVEISSFQKVYF